VRDLNQYGELEQDWFMASRPAPGGSAGATGRERTATEQAGNNFEVQSPALGANGTISYDPASAYRSAVATDAELGGLHPAAALRASNSESDQAVNMTGVAALFVAALVLFTLAQVMLGRRPRKEPPLGGRWTVSHTLVVGGTLVTATAAVLFTLVMVP
jgi:hypothetical protein